MEKNNGILVRWAGQDISELDTSFVDANDQSQYEVVGVTKTNLLNAEAPMESYEETTVKNTNFTRCKPAGNNAMFEEWQIEARRRKSTLTQMMNQELNSGSDFNNENLIESVVASLATSQNPSTIHRLMQPMDALVEPTTVPVQATQTRSVPNPQQSSLEQWQRLANERKSKVDELFDSNSKDLKPSVVQQMRLNRACVDQHIMDTNEDYKTVCPSSPAVPSQMRESWLPNQQPPFQVVSRG